MLQSDFERFAAANAVSSVVLYQGLDSSGWEVFAYGHPDHDALAGWVNRLQVVKGKSPKTYTSLDRAFSAIRAMGYHGPLTIDG